jgi:hypothetical protein
MFFAPSVQKLYLSSGHNRKVKNIDFSLGLFSAVFRPNWVAGPLQTGQARKMVQKAPKNNPGD